VLRAKRGVQHSGTRTLADEARPRAGRARPAWYPESLKRQSITLDMVGDVLMRAEIRGQLTDGQKALIRRVREQLQPAIDELFTIRNENVRSLDLAKVVARIGEPTWEGPTS
jgi:hypothetical protein